MSRFVIRTSIILVTLSLILSFVAFAVTFSGRSPAATSLDTPANTTQKITEFANDDELSLREIKFICNDEKIRPMWIGILKDERFNSLLLNSKLQEEYDCSTLLRISEVDLNDDGTSEYAISVQYIGVCSATANCPVAFYGIFDDEKSKMRTSAGTFDFSHRKILFSNGMIGYELLESKSNGYRDILLRHNGSSYNDLLFLYSFDGYEYQMKRCYEEEKGTNQRTRADCPKN